MGMPTKYFRSGRPGLRRLGVVADIEARQPRDSADKKQEADEGSGVKQILMHLRIDRFRQKVKAPDQRQQAGRNAESDRVGQRIQFLAKVAARVREARRA